MSRFVDVDLDLSRLPAPTVIRSIDQAAIRAARIASLTARYTAAGIEWDVGGLETDPGVILQEEDAFREVLGLGAINDAARAVMPAYAVGSDLDAIGVRYGVYRATGELDPSYRRRIALSFEAYTSCGSPGAYEYFARSVDPLAIRSVGVTSPAPGEVRVVVLGTADGKATPAALVERVRARLHEDAIKPLTDVVTVQGATIRSYALEVVQVIPSGPSPAAVAEVSRAGLATLAAERYRVGAGLDLTAIVGAAWAPEVRRTRVVTPAAAIAADPGAAPWCTAIVVRTEVVDD
jgi:phage-related baseplate assembly protein